MTISLINRLRYLVAKNYFFAQIAAISFCIFIASPIKSFAQQALKNLNYFLNHAKSTSPVLKDLANQQKATGVDSLIAKATGKLQVTGTGMGMYAPVVQDIGFDKVLTNGQALEALLNVNYDLLNKKRINNQLEAIKIQSDSINYASQLSVFDLSKSITDQYIQTYASQQMVDFNQDVVLLLRKEDQLLKTLTRNNIYKQSEYLTFLVTLQQQQLNLSQAELQFKSDYSMLNYLAGIGDTTNAKLDEPKLKNEIFNGDKSFFITRFELDSLKNINQKNSVDLTYKPKLGVYVNGGYNSSFALQPYKNFGTSVGFTFSIPIYDGNQKKMQNDKLAISSSTVSGYKEYFTWQQVQQLNLIRQQLVQTDALFSKINEQIKFSKGLIDVDSKLLHTGDVKVADFVIAINNYLSAQNLLRQANINRLKLINQYNYWNR